MRTMPLDMGAESEPSYEPAAHYDRVHEAWRLILGEELTARVLGITTSETGVAFAGSA